MQEPHGTKGALQGLGFAESMVNTFEQSAKSYWRMWGPLGEPMVRTVDAWGNMQRGYLQWLREASATGGGGATQRIATEANRNFVPSAREIESSFAQMVREAQSSAREAQRIAREVQRDATAEAEEEDSSEEIRSVVKESVRRSEEGSWDREPQDGATTDLQESPADAEALPLEDYDSLTVSQVTQRFGELSVEEIERLRAYEAEHRNRRSLLERFERRLRAARREDLEAREEGVGNGEAEEGSEEEIGSIVKESVRRSAGEDEE
jgi:hypothetical protein